MLSHPHVSRLHARLSPSQSGLTIADLGSANGTFVNGKQITRATALKSGDEIDIGPFSLAFDGQKLSSCSRANNVQLAARALGFRVSSGKKELHLLNDVNLVFNPGEFVCLLGPSGSGKSTLLNLLSGRNKPSEGQVYLNGRGLHDNFSALREDMVVVPQATLLHETLSVDQTFRFTAKLRLPPDTSNTELTENVESMLGTVGLTQRKQVKIRNLSGGQLKRAGLGTELMTEPSLLFLDEVTSGLDEHSDGEMMQLFRSLADSGKTVVCITHNLFHVEDNAHRVVVLSAGGRLAFFGSPNESKNYFQASKLSDIYTILPSKPAEEWAKQYKLSEAYQKYVASRMPHTLHADGESGGVIAGGSPIN